MNFTDKCRQAVKNFLKEKSSAAFIISIILIVLFVLAVIAGIRECASKPKKTKELPVKENLSFSPTEDFLEPKYQSLSGDYYFSRISGKKWGDEEVKQWFTMPDKDTVEKLSQQNDKMIDTLLGDTP